MASRALPQSTITATQMRRRRDVSRMGVVVGLLILVYFIALFLIPFGRSIWLSFQNWDFIVEPTYVGFRNYRKALDDAYFWEALRVTLVFAAARIGLSLVLAFLVALGVSQLAGKVRNVFIGLFYIPVVVPGVVSILLWKWLYLPSGGAFNSLLSRFSLPEQPFLNSSSQALWAIVVFSIWAGIGSAIIIFYAGINDVPSDLLEAAELDGAGLWKKTTGVILPLLRPVLFYEIVVGIIGAVQAFEVFYLMPGPGFSTRTLTLYTYELGFKSLNLGYGATVSIFVFILLLVATVFQFRRYMASQAK